MNRNCCGGTCASLELSVLKGLTDEQRTAIRNFGLTLHFKKGQKIVSQGADVEGVFCVKEGSIKIVLESSNGDLITVKLLHDKGTVGHESLALKSYMFTATCLSDTRVCFLPKSLIDQLVESTPQVGKNICVLASMNTNRLRDVIISLRSKSVMQRVAENIITLQETFGKDQNGCIDVDMTKEEMSNIVGSSVESVFRNLSELRSKGYIKMDGRRIVVTNESRLRAIGRVIQKNDN